VLTVLALAQPVEAQYFRLAIDEISVQTPTDGDGEDDLYVTIVGITTTQGTNTILRMIEIAPPAPDHFYRMGGGSGVGAAVLRSLPLWDGNWLCCLGQGEVVYLAVFIRERDGLDKQERRDTFERLVGYLSERLVAGRQRNFRDFVVWGGEFLKSMERDGDDTIGAFAVALGTEGQLVAGRWSAINHHYRDPNTITTLIADSYSAAEFSGSMNAPQRSKRWDYRFRVAVQQLVRAKNSNSDKCLDVIGGSQHSGANLQQYTCTGSSYLWAQPNQLFAITPAGVSTSPAFYFQVQHSGQCLDVEWASRDDHAAIQQHSCHFGLNQQWLLNPRVGPIHSGWELRSLQSYKCIDVVGASSGEHAAIQQFGCHGGGAQLFDLEGYRPFRSRPVIRPR
jgi:hypothetical protein